MIYFISDTHFGHANIIKYTDRPFQSVEEMDETLIYNWNSIVKKGDTVYHLGDFCLGSLDTFLKYIKRLNGNINILRNADHHDKRWIDYFDLGGDDDYLNYEFEITKTKDDLNLLDPIYDLKSKNNHIVLCHFPIYYWNKKHYLSYHLYGHIHRTDFNIPNSPLSMNVSVENINYTPISIERVIEIMDSRIKKFDLKPINEE